MFFSIFFPSKQLFLFQFFFCVSPTFFNFFIKVHFHPIGCQTWYPIRAQSGLSQNLVKTSVLGANPHGLWLIASDARAGLRVYTDVELDVCKSRCRMPTGFPANVDGNVDGNVESISIYHGKKAQKNQNHMLKRCRIICWYTCIYIYTHKHTHTQKGSFSKHFHEKKCKKLGTDSKKCQCRLKRPANVEHMSMSMVPPNVDPIWSTSVYTLTRGGSKAKAPPLAARPELTGWLASMDLAAPTQRLILSHRTAVPHALYWFWTGFCRRPIPNQTMILVWLGIGRLQTSDFKKEQRKGFSGKHMGNHWNFWSNPYRARRLRD